MKLWQYLGMSSPREPVELIPVVRSKGAAIDPPLPEFHGLTAGGINRVKFCDVGAWAFTPVEHLAPGWWESPGGVTPRVVPKCWGSTAASCPICAEARRQCAEWRALLPEVPNARQRKNMGPRW
jgi:hypothetical protein